MKITPAESLIMEALWRTDEALGIEDIREALKGEDWTDGTVRTFMTRLVAKKAVSAKKVSRRFYYRPLVERGDYVHAESRGLLDRLFDGQVGAFVAQFSEREDLSPDDIARLRGLIEKLDDDQ
jgi:predicted transcriptional regulator